MTNYKDMIMKLQTGINKSGALTVTYNQNQFYSREQHRPINMYSIKLVEWNPETGRNEYTEIFKSARQLFVVFFLRNLWFTICNREITDTGFPDFEAKWEQYKIDHLEAYN